MRELTEKESAVIEAALDVAFWIEAARHGPVKPATFRRALDVLHLVGMELQNETAPDTWSSL